MLSDHAALSSWRVRIARIAETIFHPAPRLTVSEWAEEHRVLSRETSAEPGPWHNDRTPYLVEIMDALSDPEVTEMVVMKSARVGYTEGVIGNGIGYFIDQEPSPQLVYQPTESDAEDWSKKQLSPMLRDSARLAQQADPRNSTILDKMFLTGSTLTIRGGFSPRAFRRITARIVWFDEVSALVEAAGKEGDPVKLGEARADTFANRKIVKGSTPTIKGLCRITHDFERSDKRYWHVPCPHCDHEQVLRWGTPTSQGGIKWDREVFCKGCGSEVAEEVEECPDCDGRERNVIHDPDSAYYQCEECGDRIEEHQKPAIIRSGRFIATNPGSPVRGWHINALMSLISPKARWPYLVREWLEAQQDPQKLQVFVNTVLGEPWEERGEEVQVGAFQNRAEDYRDSSGNQVDVPDGVGLLTAAVDVQESGWLELLVVGWGAGEESWRILHERIYGNVRLAETWARLEPLLVKPYQHASGAQLRIRCACIDSGAVTDAVYAFTLPRQARHVYATKGQGGAGQEPVKRAKKAGRDGVILYTLGVDTLKDTLFSRLRRTTPGPGYMHYAVRRPDRYNGFDAEFYEQYGAEKKIRRRKRGSRQAVHEYVQIRARNETIDLEVMNIGALGILGAGVRVQLDSMARQISERGEKHKEAFTTQRKKRKVRSKGIR